MRFASVPVPQPPQRSAAADFILRLAGAQLRSPANGQPVRDVLNELPIELDQRVRLVGEW